MTNGIKILVHIRKNRPYETLEEIVHEPTGTIIPIGFCFDGATVPRLARPFFDRLGRNAFAALLHDRWYYTGEVARHIADRWLRDILIEDGVPRWRAWIIWSAVRIVGWRWYANQ